MGMRLAKRADQAAPVIQTVRDHKTSDIRLKPKIREEGQTEKGMRTL
jgi:hypothetical protein